MKSAATLGMMIVLAACSRQPPSGEGAASSAAATPTGGAASATVTTDAPVAVGALARDVVMKLHDGKVVKLSELRGSQVLIYFYPKDDTAG